MRKLSDPFTTPKKYQTKYRKSENPKRRRTIIQASEGADSGTDLYGGNHRLYRQILFSPEESSGNINL